MDVRDVTDTVMTTGVARGPFKARAPIRCRHAVKGEWLKVHSVQ